jgi:hypothetical protein
VLFAGATGAWVIATDLWRRTLECFDTGVVMMAVMRVAMVMIVAMVVAAATIVVDSDGRNGGHISVVGGGLCGGSGAHDVSNV